MERTRERSSSVAPDADYAGMGTRMTYADVGAP